MLPIRLKSTMQAPSASMSPSRANIDTERTTTNPPPSTPARPSITERLAEVRAAFNSQRVFTTPARDPSIHYHFLLSSSSSSSSSSEESIISVDDVYQADDEQTPPPPGSPGRYILKMSFGNPPRFNRTRYHVHRRTTIYRRQGRRVTRIDALPMEGLHAFKDLDDDDSMALTDDPVVRPVPDAEKRAVVFDRGGRKFIRIFLGAEKQEDGDDVKEEERADMSSDNDSSEDEGDSEDPETEEDNVNDSDVEMEDGLVHHDALSLSGETVGGDIHEHEASRPGRMGKKLASEDI